jgi:predicted O-methyltransferase YrrM
MNAKSAVIFARSRMHGEVHNDHAKALFNLVKQYNKENALILEIGVKLGFTVAIMAMACPKARIIGVNPSNVEIRAARNNLAPYKNTKLIAKKSWHYLPECQVKFDVIFVDGDHNRVAKDLPWWSKLKKGGLMLFHDYDKAKSRIVYNELNNFAKQLKRGFDFYMVVNGNGLVGFYK